jgi:hypothetical protein
MAAWNRSPSSTLPSSPKTCLSPKSVANCNVKIKIILYKKLLVQKQKLAPILDAHSSTFLKMLHKFNKIIHTGHTECRAASPTLKSVDRKPSSKFYSKIREKSPYFRDIPIGPDLKPIKLKQFKPDTVNLFNLRTMLMQPVKSRPNTAGLFSVNEQTPRAST